MKVLKHIVIPELPVCTFAYSTSYPKTKSIEIDF